jgi:aminomethyltransferase
MPRKTPFHPRTEALCTSYAWKEWAGYLAVCNYDRHSEREYFSIRHAAGLIDVSPLYKVEVTGPDASAFLARVWCRDITKCRVGQVVYSTLCDVHGKCLDDGTVSRLGREHFRVTSSESWIAWFQRLARGFDVSLEDSTHRIASLALQGPHARDVLREITEFDVDRMRFFRARPTKIGGVPVVLSRTGYTGDLGYELWCDNDRALDLWDAVVQAGRIWGLEPIGLDALDVARIEAGFVLQGVDYVSARCCVIEARKSTPSEAGLGWTVDLTDRPAFIGQQALLREQETGQRWDLVGLELDWAELAALYGSYGLPPHLAPSASRDPVPVYNGAGKQVGQATSHTWSPHLKKYIALAQVRQGNAAIGTQLQIEHTVEFERRRVTATVVERPFFDPARKKSTPKTGRPAGLEATP